MRPKVLKTEKEHRKALARVEELWDAPKGSPKAAELELWSLLVETYEREHHALLPPDPVDAVRFRLDQLGLEPSDLARALGGRNRVSEVLRRKRALSVSMMRNLYKEFQVPAESLLAEPQAKYKP